MNHVILFRKAFNEEAEERAARRHFQVVNNRVDVPPKSHVIGRYSVLPFYRELEQDLSRNDSVLINSTYEHNFIADMMSWIPILGDLTPATWDSIASVPCDDGPFVLKGQTNSRKDKWFTHMFASDKRDAIQVMMRLQDDGLIGSQKIYIRKYEPLVTLSTDTMGGAPITEEFRFFIAKGHIIDAGFYWQSYADDIKVPILKSDMTACVQLAINRLHDENALPNFLVIDVARKLDGQPIVIELNDGQMSGLSTIDPDKFYATLASVL